jgi:hypothetical protein
MPDDKQLQRLQSIVLAAHPWLATEVTKDGNAAGQFRLAFSYLGHVYRTETTNKRRYFHSWIEDANDWLHQLDIWREVGGAALLCAVIGHGDICWQRADHTVGALLEIGADPYSGRRCANAWRGILDGTRTLLKPMSAVPLPPEGTAIPVVKITDLQTGEDLSNSQYNLWQR